MCERRYKDVVPVDEKKEISELQKKNQSKKPDNFFFIFFLFLFFYFSSFLEVIISSLLADSFPNILFERNSTGCPKMWTSLFTVVYIEMVAGVEWLHHRVRI